MHVLYLLSAVRCVYSECLFKIDLAIIGLGHLGKVSRLEEKKNGRRFVCLRVIQKSLLISSLVVDCFFRKGSVFDMFEALCETSKQFGTIESDGSAQSTWLYFHYFTMQVECKLYLWSVASLKFIFSTLCFKGKLFT